MRIVLRVCVAVLVAACATLARGEEGAFTLGSTADQVAAVQGYPRSIIGNTWSYGLSSVYFTDGRVSGWSEIDTDLRVSIGRVAPARQIRWFSIGSTPEQVVAAHGTPRQLIGSTWSYGLSSVYFDGGRVSGWSEIDTDLRAWLGTASPGAAPFALGAGPEQVVAAQGTPTSIIGSTWSYGLSSIYFRAGRVSGWSEIDVPLRVGSARSPAASPATAAGDEGATSQESVPSARQNTLLTTGATGEEVRHCLGEPTSTWRSPTAPEARWTYPGVIVSFRERKVSAFTVTDPTRYTTDSTGESRVAPGAPPISGEAGNDEGEPLPDGDPLAASSTKTEDLLDTYPRIRPGAGVAENGSYYGEPNANGVPKTVYVDGYFRSDGTYVQGHYRSAPGTNTGFASGGYSGGTWVRGYTRRDGTYVRGHYRRR